MKTTLAAAVVVASSLFSTAAFADDCEHGASAVPQPPPGQSYGVQNANYGQGYGAVQYADYGGGRHKNGGRYELQSVQKWVPGGYTQVWVNGFCHADPLRVVRICTQGHYENRWTPGRYETAQEWVWVDHHGGHNRYGRHGGYGR